MVSPSPHQQGVAQLLVYLLTVLQVLSNVSQVNSARLPPALRAVYRGIALLQLQGAILPPSCTNGNYFEADFAFLSLGMGLWVLAVSLSVIHWRVARPGLALWFSNYATALVAVYLHPSISSTALGLVSCQYAQLSQRAILALDGGAAHVSGGSASPAGGSLATVSLLSRNPYIMCFSEWHALLWK